MPGKFVFPGQGMGFIGAWPGKFVFPGQGMGFIGACIALQGSLPSAGNPKGLLVP